MRLLITPPPCPARLLSLPPVIPQLCSRRLPTIARLAFFWHQQIAKDLASVIILIQCSESISTLDRTGLSGKIRPLSSLDSY
jgi:hypothetical protein